MSFLRSAPFRRQVTALVAAGVFCIALLTSLASSWQGSRRIHDNLIAQGERIAEKLASQSRLALLYASPDNAEEAVKTTLSFPDVIAVEIIDASGAPLLQRASLGQPLQRLSPPSHRDVRAALERETPDDWLFVAPVLVGDTEASPFDIGERNQQILGYVRVLQSKATLTRLVRDVFATNLAVSISFALILLIVLRLLTGRLLKPLNDLSEIMARAENGETGARAQQEGPRDIADMAHAFNSMMAVLEEREAELRSARDHALRYAKLKAEFAATVSHEVRTPLNGVIGTLDMLRATTLPPRQRDFVNLAWDSSQYLLELINNILDFSKLEAGKVALESRAFNPTRMVEDVLEMTAGDAQRKGIQIGSLSDAGLPPRVLGDEARIKQVLTNLIGNAIKFTSAGEVSAVIERVPAADDTVLLRCTVADTGIGIAPEACAHIFDSFSQADASTTRRFGGTGLGLSISRQLVTLMGGTIDVASTPGQGSRFWFTVSCAEAEPAQDTKPSRTGSPVLLVIEDGIVRRSLEQTLDGWGFACTGTDNTDSALRMLHDAIHDGTPYAHILIDADFATAAAGNLPGQLRSNEWLSGIRVVLLHDHGFSPMALGIPAHAYLTKPPRRERLCAALEDLAPAQPESPPTTQRSSRVLVVEDNRSNQIVAQGMLQMLGCQVEIANGGSEGIQAFRRGAWDIVLMDCNMPDMDGYETTAAIRALETNGGRRVPIVAMTANTLPTDVEKCLSAGMDDHLAKPLMLDHLAEKLGRWVAGDRLPSVSPDEVRNEGEHLRAVVAEPLDAATLAKLHEVMGNNLEAAILPFLEDMPNYIERIERGLAAEDAAEVADAAHTIKGAASNLGALTLAAEAKEIEARAEGGRLQGAEAAVDRLTSEYSIARQALIAELRGVTEAATDDDTPKPPLALVVDDDRSTRVALRHSLLRAGFRVEEACHGLDALELLERILPDVILMDAMMPELDGFATCARLREMPRTQDIPVLMITALEDQDSIERAFVAGANDYIPKPIHFPVVHKRVRRMIEASSAQHHIRRLAFNDTLTGLPNRTMLTNQLKRLIGEAAREQKPLAILMLDLDRFKYINDTLGHDIGDRLLKAVAQRVRQSVRTNDYVARLGGDEFTVVLDELPTPGLASIAAQKITRALATPFQIDGHDLFVTASIGISVYPDDGADAGTLLRHADTAMYRAKKTASGFQFYEAAMETSISDQVRMEAELRRAIERDELAVYYQPLSRAGDGAIVGFEALVRWHHPTRGMVSPATFIPLAEETGLIGAIGEWVLREACRQAQSWLMRGMPLQRLSVNLSGKQLQQPGIAETVEAALRATGLPARILTLEITESVVMEHAHETIGTLQRLKDLGICLAIDDFGTGYSSLAYLKRFPVDVLKIDQSFVRDVPDDADDAAIVTGIVALAHSLRLGVVAEGVETEAQRQFLVAQGCNYLQGYLLSQPKPAKQLEADLLVARFPELDRINESYI